MKIYSDLDTAIDAALTGTAGMKHKEAYNEQYTNTEEDTAKLYPAVYYELLDPVSWTQSGHGYLQGKLKVRLHCVVKDLRTAKNRINDFSEAIFQQMHQKRLVDGAGLDLTTEWCLMNSSLPKRYKNLKVIKLDFQFEAFAYSSLPQNQNFAGPFNVSISTP